MFKIKGGEKIGYRLKYKKGSLKITKYNKTPSGKKLKNKYAIIHGTTLISAVRGISKQKAKKQIQQFQKEKYYKFP